MARRSRPVPGAPEGPDAAAGGDEGPSPMGVASGVRVGNLELHFGVDAGAVRSLCTGRRSAHSLTEGQRAFSPYVDPGNPDRYVVVSVDPGGGGVLSDEAFVVFLVAGNDFGLLSGWLPSSPRGATRPGRAASSRVAPRATASP